jgi:hypothetical protein
MTNRLTEEQIERRVERLTDRWDSQLMAGHISQKQYDEEMRHVAKWAEQEYRRRRLMTFPIND